MASDLGKEVEVVIAQLDAVQAKYQAALDKARRVADSGGIFGEDMADILATVKEGINVHRESSSRVQQRVKQMNQRAHTMLEESNDCKLAFIQVQEQLGHVCDCELCRLHFLTYR